MRAARVVLGSAAAVGGAIVAYRVVGRRACPTWGATDDEVRRTMAGDDLLVDPDIVATRAVTIAAPPSAIWPWLMQMGSGRGGVYTYDWIENLLGLHMHSADRVHPEWQDRAVGDAERLGTSGPVMRVAVLEPGSAMVLAADDGNWVWSFGLFPDGDRGTRLVSRNRIGAPGMPAPVRMLQSAVLEPGSLLMERKMLIGIKERAEALGAVAA
jgi:hypothetical protein